MSQQVNPDLKPPKVTLVNEDEPPITEPPSKSRFNLGGVGGGKSNILQIAIISIVATIAVLFVMNMAGGVFFISKAVFDKNLAITNANVVAAQTDITTVKSDVAIRQGSMQKVIDSLPDTVKKAADVALAEVIKTANEAKAKAESADKNAELALNNTNKISAGSLNVYTRDEVNNQISNVNQNYNTLKTSIDNQAKTNTDFEARIKKLESNPVVTITPTPTTTPTTTIPATGYDLLSTSFDNPVTATLRMKSSYDGALSFSLNGKTDTTTPSLSKKFYMDVKSAATVTELEIQYSFYLYLDNINNDDLSEFSWNSLIVKVERSTSTLSSIGQDCQVISNRDLTIGPMETKSYTITVTYINKSLEPISFDLYPDDLEIERTD